jgi:replicative DNA helicase
MQDPAAERAVLAGVATFGLDAFIDVADLVTANAFSVDSNQMIWGIFSYIFTNSEVKSLDLPTILSSAHVLGFDKILQKNEEKEHLRAILNTPIRKENIRGLARKVKKLEVARQGHQKLIEAQHKIEKVTGDEHVEQILGITETPSIELIESLLATNEDELATVGEGIQDYIQYLRENKRDITGIATGFSRWDTAIGGGLRNGTVSVIGARIKTGKTSLAINLGSYISGKMKIPVCHIDLEMTKEDLNNRVLSHLSGVDIGVVETGKFVDDPNLNKRIEKAGMALQSFPYTLVPTNNRGFEENLSVVRRWITRKVGFQPNGKANPCCLIFDYLKLTSSSEIDSRNLAEFQVLGFMLTAIHSLAGRYGIPVVLFVQLNRDGIDREDSAAFAGSDRIGWFSSNLSILKKKSPEEIAEQNGPWNRKLVPTDCRHGPGLAEGDYINIHFRGDICTIKEGPTRNELNNRNDGEIVDEDNIKF